MSERAPVLRIATAGWTIPGTAAENFPREGQGLERYASRFTAVEINSTFYRSHRASTYARWAQLTPDTFRFAVKLPRTITHEARLANAMSFAKAFRAEVGPLGEKLGPLLVQLPPSLAFSPELADPFFSGLRAFWPDPVVCEPRHASWFEPDADACLTGNRVGRVAADPARHPKAEIPGGWTGIAYWRLHGAPRMYYSAYDDGALETLSAAVSATPASEAWCVFDNTASGAAMWNALSLRAMIHGL